MNCELLKRISEPEIARRLLRGATFAFVVLVGSIWALTLSPDHNWTDDFSQYIHHAVNLVDGKHYADTGYIVSDSSVFSGPYTYPPVLPLLLAPVYWSQGLDLQALKLVGVISFCFILLLLPTVFGDRLTPLKIFALVFLVGANPQLWTFRNDIASEFPFMVFSFGSLCLIQKFFRVNPQQSRRVNVRSLWDCAWIGLVAYLAYGTRDIGLVLPLCVIGCDVLVNKKITILSLLSVSTFVLLVFAQVFYLNEDFTPVDIRQSLREFSDRLSFSNASSLVDFISLDVESIVNRVKEWRWVVLYFFPSHGSMGLEIINTFLIVVGCILSGVGYLGAVRRKMGALELFCAGYVVVLMLFGGPAYARYFYPLFPFVVYYALVGYGDVFSNRAPPKLKCSIAAFFLSLVVISYAHGIYVGDSRDSGEGVTHPDALEVFEFIRKKTPEDAVIVARTPRTVALFTNRHSIGEFRVKDATSEMLNEFYVAANGSYFLQYEKRGKWVRPLRESLPPTERFTEIFRNMHFAVYKFERGDEPVVTSGKHPILYTWLSDAGLSGSEIAY